MWNVKNGDDWVSACRNVVVAGVRCVGRGRKTWRMCKSTLCTLNGHSTGICENASYRGKRVLKINDDDDHHHHVEIVSTYAAISNPYHEQFALESNFQKSRPIRRKKTKKF